MVRLLGLPLHFPLQVSQGDVVKWLLRPARTESMLVIFDKSFRLIGIYWHENDHGIVVRWNATTLPQTAPDPNRVATIDLIARNKRVSNKVLIYKRMFGRLKFYVVRVVVLIDRFDLIKRRLSGRSNAFFRQT